MARLIAVLVGILAVILGSGTAYAKAPSIPPTLSGEILNGGMIMSSCTQNSPTSYTVNWTVSGTATGPYPGTFTESGSITNPTSGVMSGSASFLITSPNGTMTGTKTMAHQTPNTGTSCGGAGLSAVENELDYSARVNTGQKNKNYCDSGRSSLSLSNPGGVPPSFQETFTSGQASITRCK